MDPELIAFTIALALGTVCLMVVYKYVYLVAVTSMFRQQVFALRRRLFLVAADGAVSFDNPSYGRLRTSMNGTLRYAERVSFSRIVFLNVMCGNVEDSEPVGEQEWEPAIAEIHDEYARTIAMYILFTSPTLLALWVVLTPLTLVARISKERLSRYLERGAERLSDLPAVCS